MNAPGALAREQALLLDALFGDGPLPDAAGLDSSPALQSLQARGWQAYRATGEALASRALTAAYPVLAELIGDDSFAPLAAWFWRMQPPARGDIAQWGGGLPDFLDAAPQLADEPFLGDVARVEWALHRAATAPDAVTDVASLALLAGDAPGRATLALSGGVALLASDWPVVSIVQAHLLSGDEKTQALTQVAALLQAGTGETALVWRQGFRPQVRLVCPAEHALLSALLPGLPLEDALNEALEIAPATGPDSFDFSAWLGQAMQTGLVTGAKHINIDNPEEEFHEN